MARLNMQYKVNNRRKVALENLEKKLAALKSAPDSDVKKAKLARYSQEIKTLQSRVTG